MTVAAKIVTIIEQTIVNFILHGSRRECEKVKALLRMYMCMTESKKKLREGGNIQNITIFIHCTAVKIWKTGSS